MGRVEDKVAIVTGGGAGIGRASSKLLASEGAKVVVADIDEQRAVTVVKEIAESGGTAIAATVDVGQPAEIETLMQRAVDEWGRLDILHNNAALTAGWQHAGDLSVLDVDADTWGRSIRINLESVLYACKYAVPHMIEGGGGSIVNTSSNQAFAGDMTQTAYASSKAAVISLSRSVATQFGKQNIRCNVVSPGCILTENTLDVCPADVLDIVLEHNLLPRHGYAEDLAKAVLFLASDDASFITGEVIKVDGGQLAHLPQYADLARMGARTTK